MSKFIGAQYDERAIEVNEQSEGLVRFVV